MSETSKRYVIFGATGSVGSTLARNLVADGNRVMLVGRDGDKLQKLAAELDQPTSIAEATNAEQIEAAFQSAADAFEGIDGVVNCMGTVLLKPAHLTTDDEFQETIGVNLFSSFAIVRAAGKTMKREGGSVVLVSSSAAQIGMSNHEAIAAAKAGIEGLVRSAAATYASRGLRFNAIAPGLVKSEMTRSIWENESSAAFSKEMHAAGRLGEPGDIASAIAWMLDPANNWLTGQVLGVDGGLARVMPRRKMK